jgi:nucleotide-binding universal stress UspA family protein
MKTILVPLDGSRMAEEALPAALGVATARATQLHLVTVHETIPPHRTQGAPPYDPALDAEMRRERRKYLDAVAAWVRGNTREPVFVRVLDGHVVTAIAEYIEANGVDLVVMTTVGRGGLANLCVGSTADGLVRRIETPALLVHPDLTRPRALQPNGFARVLVPLDGSEFSEAVIEHAITIAGVNAEYTLLSVVQLLVPEAVLARVTPGAHDEAKAEQRQIERRLNAVVARLRGRGLNVDAITVLHHNPAQVILEQALACDLVAMSTHAYGPVGRLLIGSVAHKVLHSGRVPVLMHHAPDEYVHEGAAGRAAGEPRPDSARA